MPFQLEQLLTGLGVPDADGAVGAGRDDLAAVAAEGGRPDVALVAGEGLAGIVVAFLAFNDWVPKSAEPRLGGTPGEIAALAVALAVGWFLVSARRSTRG